MAALLARKIGAGDDFEAARWPPGTRQSRELRL